jgi:hypothetical protein
MAFRRSGVRFPSAPPSSRPDLTSPNTLVGGSIGPTCDPGAPRHGCAFGTPPLPAAISTVPHPRPDRCGRSWEATETRNQGAQAAAAGSSGKRGGLGSSRKAIHPFDRKRESGRLLLNPLTGFIRRGADLCCRRSARRIPFVVPCCVFADERSYKLVSATRFDPSKKTAIECHETWNRRLCTCEISIYPILV